MFYLISSETSLESLISPPQLKKVQNWGELHEALFHKIFSKATPYNSDFLIALSELKENRFDHSKKDQKKTLESRLRLLGRYRKKNIDIFILASSGKEFRQAKDKLTQIAEKNNIKIDCNSISKTYFKAIKNEFIGSLGENAAQNSQTTAESLTEDFFKIKQKYNKAKIPNMNRLTSNGLSEFDEWFKNGYVTYKLVSDFARNSLNIPSGTADEKKFYRLFGYLPSESDEFSEEFYSYLKKLIKQSETTAHKLSMICKYYLNESPGDVYSDYKPSYEYIILGKRRSINRQFLIYISLALGLPQSKIKKLFKKGNCVLTDFLKEDLLLNFFAENGYRIDIRQRGSLFRYLWKSN